MVSLFASAKRSRKLDLQRGDRKGDGLVAVKPAFIVEDHLELNKYSRCGHKRPETEYLVAHWTGPYNHRAKGVRDYYNGLKDQDPSGRRFFRGAQYIVDYEDELVIEAMPDWEVSYTCGGAGYTSWAKSNIAERYLTNAAPYRDADIGWTGHTPNWVTIDVEICHPNDPEGRFNNRALGTAAQLFAWLCKKEGLDPWRDIVTHHMITGKECPMFWVRHPDSFAAFKERVAALMEAK